MKIRQLFPSRDDLTPLRTSWRTDITAGLTVGIVALPLALAFGVSSGVGAAAGLVTAIVAGLVAAIFGGSHIQVSGPTGAMAVILAPIVARYGATSVALVAIMSGIILIVAALIGLGRAISFIPWPVIEGFTTGIACIIFLQQVPAFMDSDAQVGMNAARSAWLTGLERVSSPSLGMLWSIATVAGVAIIMIGARHVHRSIPGSLIAVILATTVAEAAHAPLARIHSLPTSLSAPGLPPLSLNTINALFGAALAVAALAGIESLLSIRVAATMSDTGNPQPNRELFGQGLASIAAGFFGGMPATGAIARTAVNVNAGARSRLAAIVHSLLLLAVVYLVAPAVALIPLSALSGVLMVVAVRMVDLRAARAIITSTRSGAFIYVLTAGITVAFDLIQAVQVGVLGAAFFALRSLALSSGARREPLPGLAHDGDERIALFCLDGSVFFGAADRVLDEVLGAAGVHVVIIRMSQVTMLDATGARKLSELVTVLERRGITVLIKGIQAEHLQLATNIGVIDSLRHSRHLFDDLDAAVEHARSHVARPPQDLADLVPFRRPRHRKTG